MHRTLQGLHVHTPRNCPGELPPRLSFLTAFLGEEVLSDWRTLRTRVRSVNSLMAVPPEPPQPQPQQDPMARIPNAPLPPSDPAAAAEAAKQEGNEAFKNGDYGLARPALL